ncbi:unnamed protein product, partial [Ectocarpus sp. 12 AP-2014]
MDLAQDAVQAAEEARNSEDAADGANSGMRDRSRTRSNSSRGIQSHSHSSSDHDARHKVASLTAQLIQKEHRIRGLEQGVQTKVA